MKRAPMRGAGDSAIMPFWPRRTGVRRHLMIDRDRLILALGARAPAFDLDVRDTCASTNAELMVAPSCGDGRVAVLVCNHQTAGRGRRARQWLAWPGATLTFSARWRFAPESAAPAGLSLVVGLAVAQALEACGVPGVELKWPNDLQIYGRKLGGILVELGRHRRGMDAVVGIGLNLRFPERAGVPDRTDVISLADAMDDMPDVHVLLARILAAQHDLFPLYAQAGFEAFAAAWNQRHAHADLPVCVSGEGASVSGVCVGVDADGALRLRTDEGERRILAGDVSLRPIE